MPKLTDTINRPSGILTQQGISTSVPSARGIKNVFDDISVRLDKVAAENERANEVTYMANSSIQSTQEATKAQEELRQVLSDNPEEYSSQFMERIKEKNQILIDQAPTKQSKAQLTQSLGSRLESHLLASTRLQQGAIATRELDTAKKGVNLLQNSVYDNPDQLETALEQANQLAIASGMYLSPQQQSKFADVTRHNILDSYVKGLIETDTTRASAVLESKDLKEEFSSKQIQSYENAIEETEQRTANAAIKADNIARQSMVLDRKVGIFKDEVRQIDLDSDLEKGRYTDKEWLALSKELKVHNTKQNSRAANVKAVEDGIAAGKAFDITDNKVKKQLDVYYEDIIEPRMSEAENPDEVILSFIDEHNYMPSKFKSELLGGLHSNKAGIASQSAQVLSKLTKEQPTTIRQFDVTNDLAKARYINSGLGSGMKFEDILKGWDNALVDKNTAEHRKRSNDYKSDIKDGAFKQGKVTTLFANDPDEVPVEMESQWNDLYRKFSVDLKMSSSDAKDLAYDILNRDWKHSDVTNEKRYMKHAPELYYSQKGQSNKWMKKQLATDVSTISPEIDSYSLHADPRTIKGGQPEYQVHYFDEFGMMQIMSDKDGDLLLWKPEFSETDEFVKPEDKAKELTEKRKEVKEQFEFDPTF